MSDAVRRNEFPVLSADGEQQRLFRVSFIPPVIQLPWMKRSSEQTKHFHCFFPGKKEPDNEQFAELFNRSDTIKVFSMRSLFATV